MSSIIVNFSTREQHLGEMFAGAFVVSCQSLDKYQSSVTTKLLLCLLFQFALLKRAHKVSFLLIKKMNFKIIIPLYLLFFSHYTFANDIKLGIATELNSSVYKGVGNDFTVLPVLDYDNEMIYIDGTEAGAYLYLSKYHELSIISNYHNVGFRPKDSSDSRMKKLDRRHGTTMFGLNYTYMSNWGAIDSQVKTDLLNKNNGVIANISYVSLLQKEQFIFAPKVGLTWQNYRYSNYYYGVTESESKRSSFKTYNSKQGINPYIELNMNYQMSPKFDLFLSSQYELLNRQIKNSPIVNKQNSASIQLGFKYKI